MQRRDEIVIKKVISEIEIGLEMLGDTDLDAFLKDEKLKRALGMTVINIGELIKRTVEVNYVAGEISPAIYIRNVVEILKCKTEVSFAIN